MATIGFRAQERAQHDPAPSVLSYRLQRLYLTPAFRYMMRFGLPILLLALVLFITFAEQARRDAVVMWVNDIKRSIQERPEFMVKMMAVDGASESVAQDIREILPVEFPLSSFDLDLPEMQKTVAGIPAVERADLRIRAGGVLEVRVVEREPVAVWRSSTGLDLVDIHGKRVAPLDTRGERGDLPLVAGRGAGEAAAEAMAIFDAAGPIADRIRGLVRVGERRWTVSLAEGQSILLPEREPVRALEQVIALHEAQDILDRDVAAIDMRNPSRATVRLRETALEEIRRIRMIELGARPK
ncbi:FtsQ-type POTRA domain-containing protein [Mesobaculum littorinae]|uniref:Cell division protein FtsQ n=1 Tax=Mesobaculum littorinae TaxID=2486419 RepID=A0A438AIP0_9RHOB|nr:cell division protein FtsQ/DivIB [Mesobaculum littorinae]RVV98621.1 FtsQ-type POTRA domain-containing protein [Mesobaculum littorinae]